MGRTPEEQAAYMREYRARKRAAIGGFITASHVEGDVRVIDAMTLTEVSLDSESGLVTLPGRPEADNALTLTPEMVDQSVFAKPETPKPVIVIEYGEFEAKTGLVETESGRKSAETVKGGPKTRKNAQKPPESAEIPKNDLESTLRRNRAAGNSRWTNPFHDGLDDTPVLIARMSQKARDAILDRIPRTPHR